MTPYNLPQKWQWVKLGEICQINPKTDFNNFSDSQIVSFIPMKCVEEKTNHFTTETRTFQEVKKGYTKFQNQDILFAKITPCMENGKLCVVDNLINQRGLGSTEFHVLRCNQNRVLPLFLFFFMVQDSFLKTMEYQMTGAVGQKRIKAEIIANHQIPLPPLEIQREIVEILESKLEKIKEAKALLETSSQECETYRLSLLESAFSGNLTPHSQNWQWVSIQSVCKKIIAGGDKPLSFSQEKTASHNIPIYANAVKDNGLYGWTTEATIQEPAITISARGTIGFVCPRFEPFFPIVRLLVAIPDKKVDLLFLSYALKYILPSGNGSSIPQLTIPKFKQLSIPLPPLEIQREIVEILESKLEKIKEAKALLETSLQECETYRLSLLESAFAGELV